jgi:hypothetical protein
VESIGCEELTVGVSSVSLIVQKRSQTRVMVRSIKLELVVMSWVSEELGAANLGDLRRTARLIWVVEGLCRKN